MEIIVLVDFKEEILSSADHGRRLQIKEVN